LLKKYFPNTPILYTLGNHDCYPTKYVTPENEWLEILADDVLAEFLNP